MGFFAEFSAWLNQILSVYIGSTTAAVAAALEPALIALGILYVMVWGYLTMTGKIEEPISAGLKRILTLALILGCALQLWFYNDVIVDTFFVAPEQLAARIIGSYDSVTIVDSIIVQGSAVAERLLEKEGIFDSIKYGLAAIVVYCIIGITAIYAVFLLSLSRIALAVLLAIGPFFIALLLFETSKRLFGAWIAQLANYALIAILTTLVSALILSVLTQAAEQALAEGEGLTIAHAVRVCLAAGLTFLVLRQVMPMAAGLASGIALSTFGAMSALLSWAFVGSARRMATTTNQFSRGLRDKDQGRYDSLARTAGFRLKRGVQQLVRRANTIKPT